MLGGAEQKINNQEAASLLKQKESNRLLPSPPTPPPPERHDSKNIFIPGQTKSWKYTGYNTTYDSRETNI